MNEISLKNLLDRPIAFHRCLATAAGSVCAGLMLSQAIYWANRTTDPDGWFWKTQEEWEAETSLTRYEQEGARKLLRATGFWEEKLVGVPAKMHYRVKFDVLDKVLSQTSMGKNPKLDCGKTPNKIEEKPQTISTEITTESTTESTKSTHTNTRARTREEDQRVEERVKVLRDHCNALYRRQPGDAWTYEEEYRLVELARRGDPVAEFHELTAYRKVNAEFFPKSIHSLLLNWTKTLDEARNHQPKTSYENHERNRRQGDGSNHRKCPIPDHSKGF